jgi:hypothetical protein
MSNETFESFNFDSYTNYLIEAVAKRVCIYFELWRQRGSEQQEGHPNDENQEEYNTKQRRRM